MIPTTEQPYRIGGHFYWCKVHWPMEAEPYERWEVLHWQEDRWWACAVEGPVPEWQVVEIGNYLPAPDERKST